MSINLLATLLGEAGATEIFITPLRHMIYSARLGLAQLVGGLTVGWCPGDENVEYNSG
jgi:hypothetical protein